MEWTKVYYNGLETNVEVTRCGKVRRIRVDWLNYNWKTKLGEIDFNFKKTKSGYQYISVQIKELKQKTLQVHQLVASAFLGYKWQGHKLVIDHIDSNVLNNQVDNLKIVTVRENNSKEKSIKSGLPTGVCWYKRDKKYRSSIYIKSKTFHLGYFDTIEEASNAYQEKLNSIT